jgi:DNA-binding transcriptional LysR family regulator
MRVSCPASLAASVISALLALQEHHPNFVPDVREPIASPLPTQLLQGSIDLAITAEPPLHDELDVREVYTQQFGVYCGPRHPIFDADDAPFSSLRGQSFVMRSRHGDALDSVWPTEWQRSFALFASDLAVRLGLCMTRPVIAVLPDHAVRDHVKAGRLRRIEAPALPSRVLYAARRREVTPDDALSEAIDSIASALRG